MSREELLEQRGPLLSLVANAPQVRCIPLVRALARAGNKDDALPLKKLLKGAQPGLVSVLLEALRVLASYGKRDVAVITNLRPIYPLGVIAGEDNYPPVDAILEKLKAFSRNLWTIQATELALKMGNVLYANMIMIGALSALHIEALSIQRDAFLDVLKLLVKEDLIQNNLEAFDCGFNSVVGL